MLRLAVIGGDGTGPEVVAEGLKVLEAISKKVGFEYSTTDFNVSGDRYLERGGNPDAPSIEIISDEEIAELATYDAIYLGAVGHPGVAPGILESDLAQTFYRWPMTARERERFLLGYHQTHLLLSFPEARSYC